MRVYLMRALLPAVLLLGLPTSAWSQDYTFNVRVKLENISPDVTKFGLRCGVCRLETATVGSCYQAGPSLQFQIPAGSTLLGQVGSIISLPSSSTSGGPKSFDSVVPVSVTLNPGTTRSDVTAFSCILSIAKGDQQVELISSPQDLPVWAKPDLNKPFTAIVSGGL